MCRHNDPYTLPTKKVMYMKKLVLVATCLVFAIFHAVGNYCNEIDTIPPAMEVEGVIQTDGFLLPPHAKSGFVLTSDSTGNGSWQPVINVGINSNKLGSAELGQLPHRLAITNGHAYVIGSADDDMKIFNISQDDPHFLTSVALGTNPVDIAANGNIVVVLENNQDSLYFFDVSNPSLPVARSVIRVPGESFPRACDIDGIITGVVGQASNTLKLFDFSNPDSIVERGSVGIGGNPSEVYMSGGYAFVGDFGSLDLKIIDISDADNPQVTGSVLLGQNPARIVVSQGIAYVLDQSTDELFSVDVSDVTNPVILDTLSLNFNGFLSSLDVRNNLLFVGETVDDVIMVIDISNPADLNQVSSFTGFPFVRDLVVFEDKICVIDAVLDDIVILQLSSGIPSIDLDGNISEFDQKFDGLVEIRSPDLNDHLRLSRAGIGSVDLSISLDKTLTIENGSFFARGLGAKDSNKGFFWGESSSVVSPAVGLVYNGIGFVGENKLQLKEMIDGDTSTLVTFKLDGKVGIGTTEPGGIPGLEMAKLQVDSGHVVVSQGFGILAANASETGIGAGIKSDSLDNLHVIAGGYERVIIHDSSRISVLNSGMSIFLGKDAGKHDDLSDNQNVFVGEAAGFTNALGNKNTFIGYESGYKNLGAPDNIDDTPGTRNTYLGWKSGRANIDGFHNTMVGFIAGESNTADRNVFIGAYAGRNNTSGEKNTHLGTAAGEFSTTGSNNVVIGFMAGRSANGTGNVFLGHTAGAAETGSNKLIIANGASALPLIYGEFDSGQIGLGTNTPDTKLHVVGEDNTGTTATFKLTSGSHSMLMDGDEIDAVASDLFLQNNSADDVILVNGGGKVGIGVLIPDTKLHLAGADNDGITATLKMTTGAQSMLLDGNEIDVAGGDLFLQNNVTDDVILASGGGRVGVGTISPDTDFEVEDSGTHARLTSTSSSDVILDFKRSGDDWRIRNSSGIFLIGQSSNNFSTVNDIFRLGGGSVTPGSDNLITLGQSSRRWTAVWAVDGSINTSDARLKKNIRNLDSGLEKVRKLNAVRFQWKNDMQPGQYDRIGLLAQDVQKVLPEVVVDHEWRRIPDSDEMEWVPTEHLGVKYHELIPVLIDAIQEQQEMIDTMQEEINQLKNQ